MPILLNQNLSINQAPNQFANDQWNIGELYTPWWVARRRKQAAQAFRRLGTPVLHKHRLSDWDVRNGTAVPAPAQVSPGRDSIYGQSRYTDPLSLGTGYVSVELSPDEWYNTATGQIIESQSNPGAGYAQAPMYRGFGPGSLIYVIFLDRPRDYFAYDPGGAIYNVEQGGVIAPWTPKIWDGDLLIEIITDTAGNIISTVDFYECRMVTPVTLRGQDVQGKTDVAGQTDYNFATNRWLVNQRMEANRIADIQNDPRVTQIQLDR
jgi:hypothetical protein